MSKKAHEKIKNAIKGRPKPKPKKKSPKRPQPKLEKRKAQLDTLIDRAHQPLPQNHTNPPPSSRRLPKNRSKNKTKKRKQERPRWRMRTTYSNIKLNSRGKPSKLKKSLTFKINLWSTWGSPSSFCSYDHDNTAGSHSSCLLL